MVILQDILYQVKIRSVNGNLQAVVKDLQIDSRKVSEGSCFIAIKGLQANGHDFIEKAVSLGASVVICEEIPRIYLKRLHIS